MGVDFYLFTPDGPVDTAEQQEEMLKHFYQDEVPEVGSWSAKWTRDLDLFELLETYYCEGLIDAQQLVADGTSALTTLYENVSQLHLGFRRVLLGDGLLSPSPNCLEEAAPDGEIFVLSVLNLSGSELASFSVGSESPCTTLLCHVANAWGVPVHRQRL